MNFTVYVLYFCVVLFFVLDAVFVIVCLLTASASAECCVAITRSVLPWKWLDEAVLHRRQASKHLTDVLSHEFRFYRISSGLVSTSYITKLVIFRSVVSSSNSSVSKWAISVNLFPSSKAAGWACGFELLSSEDPDVRFCLFLLFTFPKNERWTCEMWGQL